MKNVRVAFDIPDHVKNMYQSWLSGDTLLIFDVKLDLTREVQGV
jgi:hypothetical protein